MPRAPWATTARSGTTGDQARGARAVSLGGAAVRTMAAGGNHTLAVLGDGSFRAWGADNQLQLGNGTGITGSQALPTTVDVTWPMVGITAVEAGQRHNAVLQGDGSVWTWG